MRTESSGTRKPGKLRAIENEAPTGYPQHAVQKLLADLTDAGNANWLAALIGNDLLFDHDRQIWRIFDGTVWHEDRDAEVRRMAENAVRSMTLAAANLDAQSMRKLTSHASKCLKRSALESLLTLAQYKRYATSDRFDRDDYLLAVKNGVLDLRSGQFRSASREDYLTRSAATIYDPEAEAPVWNAFLQRIFQGDRDLIDFAQKAVGYTLSGSTHEQVWFLLHGVGANGKTTFLRVLSKLLGSYAQHAAVETFLQHKGERASNDLAAMNGARLVTVTESDEGRRLASGLIKQITGGDPLTARFLYREHFTFAPKCKLWFATNQRPRITDTSEGMWRRVRFLPFEIAILESERDEHLFEKLIGELSGILNWAIAGAREWQNHGLRMPSIVAAATKAYRTEQDPIADFIVERCNLGEYSEAFATLYVAYEAFCSQTGEHEKLSQRAFAQRLDERGFASRRTTTARIRDGLCLKDFTGHRYDA